MNSTPSSLGLLLGYNSSSSNDEDASDNTDCLVSSKSSFFADAASKSEKEANRSKYKEKVAEPPLSFSSPLSSSKLPAPCLGSQSGLSSSSVFSNPFQDEKKAQLNILEGHVKLSDSNWAKGGKGVCLAYQRDGRCRYGTKCKYSHGSDLPQGSTASTQQEITGINSSNKVLEIHSLETGEEQVAKTQNDKGKRKKPGLTPTLIPPKRSLKSYQKQLTSERPWAV